MSNRKITDALRTKLGSRTKRDLIEQMIARSPHEIATQKAVAALQVYPLSLLLLACDYPTKLWILDRGEKPSSAEILDGTVLGKKWHSSGISIDECEGITDVVGNYVAIVVSWKTLLIMRHEFAHAATTFFSPSTRDRISALYREALGRGDFTEPLAKESLGEYAACALSYYFFPDLKEELQTVDPNLFNLVHSVLDEAELLSRLIQEGSVLTEN
ncbi:MAG: hypothetical protein M1358_10295 [Chloroflexi bacterium]|nr:hypothetical protein [Chloroflexota bacterium]